MSVQTQYIASLDTIKLEHIPNNYEQIGQYLNEKTPHFNDSERKKAALIASTIRNHNLLPAIHSGRKTIMPASTEFHAWNVALQSRYFDMLIKRETKENIVLDNYDQADIRWIVDFLEANDNVRKETLNNVVDEKIAPLLLLSDQFEIQRLRAMLEVQILRMVPLEFEFLESLESYQITAFPLLNAFLFLTKFLAKRSVKDPNDHEIQVKTSRLLLKNPEKTVCFKLLKKDCSTISLLPWSTGLKLDFTIDPEWEMSDAECDQIFEIAKQTTCKHLIVDILKIKLEKMGCPAHKPGPLIFKVDGFHRDNYFPENERVPEPLSDRYQSQKSFFKAPYPVKIVDLIVFLKNDPSEVMKLIEEFPEINFGLSVTQELFSFSQNLNNVKLIAFTGEPPSLENRLEVCTVLKKTFPDCCILVLSPQWFDFFEEKFHDEYHMWKNLTGTVMKIPKIGFAFDWVKNISSYNTIPKRISFIK